MGQSGIMVGFIKKQRYEFIKKHYPKYKYPISKTTGVIVKCEFCGEKSKVYVTLTKNGEPSRFVADDIRFHHRDGNTKNTVVDNIQLLCSRCHRRFHEWGGIRKWLKKAGKTRDNLPDVDLKEPIRRRVIW